jgi:protein-S-isoprenylcysteine O-methyltransferase Ste14
VRIIRRLATYVAVTVMVVVLAFFVGVSSDDCNTGECDLAGLAGLVLAFYALWACVLGVIVIECIGAAKRVRERRAAANSG